MKVKVKDLNIFILILLVILFSGSLVYKVYNDEFLLLTLLYSVWSIVKRRNHLNLKFKKSLRYCFILLISCFITVYYTHGSLSFGSALNVMLHFLFTFCVIQDIGGGRVFIKKYSETVFYLAIISLFFFLIQLVFPNLLQNIFLYRNFSATDFYTIGFYTLSKNQLTRNCGIMTEPGLYQILLNTALFFYLFYDEDISSQKRKIGIIVLALTIISSQSAVGIINLTILVFCYVISQDKKKGEKKHNNAKLFLASFALVAVMVVFFVPNIPIVSDLTSKLFVDGQLNVTGGTGRYRIISMLTDLEIFKRKIFGAGYEDYYELFSQYKAERSVINSSSCGLTYALAVFGIVNYLIIMSYYFWGVLKSKANIFVRLSILLVFLFSSWTQPLIYYPPFIAAFWILTNDKEMEEKKVLNHETTYQTVCRKI